MSSIRDLPIYLTTSNGREHIIKVFCHLFNKYWGSDSIVNLVGYEQPNMDLPDNFNFISMGEQVGGIQMWSTDLRKFFLVVGHVVTRWSAILSSGVFRVVRSEKSTGVTFPIYLTAFLEETVNAFIITA